MLLSDVKNTFLIPMISAEFDFTSRVNTQSCVFYIQTGTLRGQTEVSIHSFSFMKCIFLNWKGVTRKYPIFGSPHYCGVCAATTRDRGNQGINSAKG